MAINSSFRTLSADNMEGVVYARNYLKNSFENNSTTGWNKVSVSSMSGSVPASGSTISVGFASAVTTFAASATSPLNGKYSLNAASSAAWTAGQGFISDAFAIDRMDAGKVLTVSFDYEVVSGGSNANFSGTLGSQTFMIYIWDQTAGAWIQPAGFLGMNQSGGPGRVVCTFQSGVTIGQQYRVAVIASVASSGAVSLRFDNLSCSREMNPIGQLRNPAGTIIATGSLTPPNGYLYCNGSAISRASYAELFAAIGTTYGSGDGSTTFNLPDLRGIFARGAGSQTIGGIGYSATLGNKQNDAMQGHVHNVRSYRGNASGSRPSAESSNFATESQTATTSPLNDGTNGTPRTDAETRPANQAVAYHICFSSGSVQLSSDTDTRVVAFAANKSATQSILNTTNTVIDFNSVEINTHGSTYAAGAYTVPVSGYYKIAFNFNFSTPGSNTIFGLLFKNGLAFCRLSAQPYSSSQSGGAGSTVIYLNAGENVSIAAFQSSGSAQTLEGAGRFSVERLSGPSVVAASESVSAAYYLTAAQSISASDVQTIINFNQKDFDSHNAVTTGAGWKFTAPISGKYRISTSGMLNSAPWTAGNRLFVYVLIDGVAPTKSKKIDLRWVEVTASPELFFNGTTMVDLVAGQYIQIAAIQSNASAKPLSTSGSLSPSIEIERVGN